jgi:pSer/pThr/pTyr-binding forkhead associated (FHA) protein
MRNGQLILRSRAVPSAPPIELREGTMLLGRHSACDIVLLDPSISRYHAEFCVGGDLVTVRDLNSHNGTYLDGQRIQSAEVRAGQRLNFGDVAFQVRIAGADDSEPDSALETDSVTGRVRSITADLDKLPLSPAERRVLDSLLLGLSEKEVATRLDISPNTVHCHVGKIYKAVGVCSRAELLARFVPQGDKRGDQGSSDPPDADPRTKPS